MDYRLRSGIAGAALAALASMPAQAADRASLQLRGYVPATVGVSLQVVAPIVPVAAAAEIIPASVTINGTGNTLYQLMLMADAGVSMVGAGTTMTFDGAPLQFNNGVALLNGIQATNGSVNRQSGELLIAMRTVSDATGLGALPLDETFTLVVRAP